MNSLPCKPSATELNLSSLNCKPPPLEATNWKLSADLGKVDSTLELGQKLIDAKDRQGIQEVRSVLSDLSTQLTNYKTHRYD